MEENMNEIWKNINTNDENIKSYQVSTYGRIKNINTGRILKLKNILDGYSTISLNRVTYYVHRLVGLTFLLNPYNKPTINHIDKNKHNNNLINLEWATYKEQYTHSKPL